MKRFLRKLKCKLGLCSGQIEQLQDTAGVWWVGLRCRETGTFHSPVKSKYQDK